MVHTRYNRTRTLSASGFTLVELMVVIIILGLLIGTAVPALSSVLTRAKNASLRANARALQGVIEGYKIDNNAQVPTSRQQMCSSATYVDVQNPYYATIRGTNASFGGGSASCPAHDNTDTHTPILVWSYYVTSWGTDSTYNGVLFYVPYNQLNGDCSSTFGAADNCGGIHDNGNAAMAGGGTNYSGYEYYIITAVGQDDLVADQYRQVRNLELKNW